MYVWMDVQIVGIGERQKKRGGQFFLNKVSLFDLQSVEVHDTTCKKKKKKGKDTYVILNLSIFFQILFPKTVERTENLGFKLSHRQLTSENLRINRADIKSKINSGNLIARKENQSIQIL